MSLHPRQRIREAVAAQLRLKTAAEDRVFTSREVPWKSKELPGIAIYALDESVDAESQTVNPGVLLRTLQLAIISVVSLTEHVDDDLDARAVEIETAISADPTLGLSDTVMNVRLKETLIELAEEQGRPVGAVRLNYSVLYASTL